MLKKDAMADPKRSFIYIILIISSFIFSLFSTLKADDLKGIHGVMRPDSETLLKWEQRYLQAPQAQIDTYILYRLGATGSLSLLSHLNYIPSEYNQGQCGDCWMWAGTGVMAIALDVNNSIHDRLSVQYMNSNIGAISVDGLTCCSGGDLPYLVDFYSTFGYQQAIPWSNTNANWQDGDASCDTLGPSISTNPNYPITSIQSVTIPTHGIDQNTAIANIKSILNQNKAVYLGFIMPTNADGNDFMDFWESQPEDTVWNPDFSCGHTYSTGWGHAVLCVGYNDEDPNNSYWIILNSWGVAPGRPNGLFRLDMNMNYDCQYRINSNYNGYSFEWWTLDITYHTDKADFAASPTSGLAPLNVAFSDTSVGSFNSWTWDFGDGAASTLRNPTHIYTSAGIYTVSLTVSGPSGTYTNTKTNYITVTQPEISTSLSLLSTSCTKGNNAQSQSFQVWNSGAGTLSYTISTDQAWVCCSTTSGISTGVSDKKTIPVIYTTSNLGPGNYSATITITSPGSSNTPKTIPVSLTVYSPTIACTPISLSNSCTLGCNAAAQTFEVWNSGTGILNYTISSDLSWITCNTIGTSTGEADKKTITVFYTTTSLAVGSYLATITITDPMASNTPVVIPVSMTVNPTPSPAIAHNAPPLITSSCSQGNSPSAKNYHVWNAGSGTLNYTVSTDQSWISCNPPNGTITSTCNGGSPSTITIGYSAAGLTTGTYSAHIVISAPGALNTPLTIPVSLTVNPPIIASAPSISITPTSFSVTCVKGSNAPSQSLNVWNSGGGTLSYSIYANTAWLSCAPSRGSSSGAHDTITVSFATSSLDAGTHSGSLTISASGASNTPQTIPVSLVVSDQVSTAKSTFAMDPTSFNVTCTQGADAAEQSFNVWNSGSGTLNYSISADAAWISISPSSGSLTGDHIMITVHLQSSNLAVGEYDQKITIVSTDTNVTNSPQTIPVHLSVKGTKGNGGGGGGGCFISATASDGVTNKVHFPVLLSIVLLCFVYFSRINKSNSIDQR